jgi:type II secretory pathway component PulF
MVMFRYKALDRQSQTVSGEIEAANDSAAYKRLSERQLSVFELKSIQSDKAEGDFTDRLFKNFGNSRIKPKDLARYIRQLATLLEAGVTLLDGLTSLAKSTVHPELAKASDAIRRDLRAGKRLSAAMGTHLPQLPRYVPRLAELGEATGKSAKALTDAADRLEFEDDMREEIRTALSYPMFLVTFGTLLVFLLFLFIVPKFAALIGENTDNLPAVSKLVIGAGITLKENLILVLAGLGGFIIGLIILSRQTAVREFFSSISERLPLIGPLIKQADLGGWSRTVGMALDNGADLLAALRLGETSLRSPRLQRQFETVRSEIRAGKPIDTVLDEMVPDFDPLTIDLVRTGRTSGRLAKMLLFIGEGQEKDRREMTKRVSALTGPIAILAVSAIIGTIVISIVLAMTSLYDIAI